MCEFEPACGDRIAFANMAEAESIVSLVDDPSSIAESMIDWIPIGLM